MRREADQQDRRATRVYLTPRGRALRPQLEAALTNSIKSFTGVLEGEERLQLRQLLAKVAAPLAPRS